LAVDRSATLSSQMSPAQRNILMASGEGFDDSESEGDSFSAAVPLTVRELLGENVLGFSRDRHTSLVSPLMASFASIRRKRTENGVEDQSVFLNHFLLAQHASLEKSIILKASGCSLACTCTWAQVGAQLKTAVTLSLAIEPIRSLTDLQQAVSVSAIFDCVLVLLLPRLPVTGLPTLADLPAHFRAPVISSSSSSFTPLSLSSNHQHRACERKPH